MRDRDSARFYLWLGFSAVIAVFVVLIGADLPNTVAQSPVPTSTFTPTVPTPTNTPFVPTPTNTPVPPTPTNTPAPPTNTPTPIPPPPELGPITIEPPEGLVAVNVPLAFTMSFTEPLPSPDILDTVTWDWGDGTKCLWPPESDDCSVDQGNGTVVTLIGSHAYSQPGVYTVYVTVVDIFGQFDTATYEFVIVYDPDGGFVTGGGWIDSQAGAYGPDPTLSGKATFGFVSRYKKGSIRPTGNTTFQFKVADLNFQSDTYDWLVITGSDHARFKGSGTINGLQSPGGVDYRFMLWAGDDEPDTFRIKIWYELGDLEYVIYDNGMDQEIGDGSVVVHTK